AGRDRRSAAAAVLRAVHLGPARGVARRALAPRVDAAHASPGPRLPGALTQAARTPLRAAAPARAAGRLARPARLDLEVAEPHAADDTHSGPPCPSGRSGALDALLGVAEKRRRADLDLDAGRHDHLDVAHQHAHVDRGLAGGEARLAQIEQEVAARHASR